MEVLKELWVFYDEQIKLTESVEFDRNKLFCNGCYSVLQDLRNKLSELEDKLNENNNDIQ